MRLLDAGEADALYAAMGRRARPAAARRPTPWPASPRWAAAPASSARSPTTSSARSSPTTCARWGSISTRRRRADGPPTGRCLILVTPDAQRTMNTFPGASHELSPEALDEEQIRQRRITYLEGYLWGPDGRARRCAGSDIAHEAGRKVAFTLSDIPCIAGRREGVHGDDGQRRDRHAVRQRGRSPAARPAAAISMQRIAAAVGARCRPLVVTRGAAGAMAVAGRAGRGPARRRSPRSSTPPAPATCSPPVSSSPAAAATPLDAASSRLDRRRRSHLPFRRPARSGPQGAGRAVSNIPPRGLLRLGAGQ